MRQIDRELAEAIKFAPSGELGSDSRPIVEPAAPTPANPRRNVGLLSGLGAITGGIVMLALTLGEGASYAKTVDQLWPNGRV
jgi:hypothetical protein